MTTSLLLGAGASKEAGVPLTSEMTQVVVEAVQSDPRARWDRTTEALNFVCGAMIAYDSAQGANPYAGIDIERLFSAVQLLADRRVLEVTPFVAAWHPRVESVDRHQWPSFFEQDFQRAILGEGGRKVERLIRDAIQAETGVGDGAVYRQLLSVLTAQLRGAVAIANASETDYLLPIIEFAKRQGQLIIGSLNYDLSLEMCASRHDCKLDTGIDAWTNTGKFAGPSEGITLLKLHGSIDWCWEEDHGGEGKPPQLNLVTTQDPFADRREPGIIFGQRGKLRAEGPFMELLARWAEELEKRIRLIVVGYSFRDDHINEVIRRWLNGDSGRHLFIIDPGFPERTGFHDPDDFRSQVLWNLVPPDLDGQPQRFEAKVTILRQRASEALGSVLAI